MLVRLDDQKPWNGEPVRDVRYPINIQELWSDAELNAAGFARVTHFKAPEGMLTTGEPWYEIVGGKAIEYYNTVPTPPPAVISDRQFFQALALNGLISEDEALAAVKTGDIPAVINTALAPLPSDQKFSATMLLSGATIFERNHPMTNTLRQMLGWTDEAVDNLFRQAAAL